MTQGLHRTDGEHCRQALRIEKEVRALNVKKKANIAAIALVALASLGVGSAAIAQTGQAPAQTPAPATVQQPTQSGQVEATTADTDQVQFESRSQADDATEAPGKEDGTDQGKNEQSPSYSSSLTAPQGGDNGDETAEAKALAVTPGLIGEQAARDAALAAFDGTVQKVELDNENGAVVYSVEIINSSGAGADVKVDAGNGTVLAQEAGGADEGGKEAGEH
ncbi:MAG TPA: hypothetical protein ENH33_05895 [Actinobacteria bacterium]|nr:hypothetical protein [Actinomycetota bacterium]